MVDKQRYGLEALRDVRRVEESTEQQTVAAQASVLRAAQQRAEAAAADVAAQQAAAALVLQNATAQLQTGASAQLATLAGNSAARHRRRLLQLQQDAARLAGLARGEDAKFDAAQQQLRAARIQRELLEKHFAAWRARRAKQLSNREE